MFLTLLEKRKPLEEETTVALFINKTVLMQELGY